MGLPHSFKNINVAHMAPGELAFDSLINLFQLFIQPSLTCPPLIMCIWINNEYEHWTLFRSPPKELLVCCVALLWPCLLLFPPGEPLAGRSGLGVPRGYWNFSWMAQDELNSPKVMAPTSGESLVIRASQLNRPAPTSFGQERWHSLYMMWHVSSPSTPISVFVSSLLLFTIPAML